MALAYSYLGMETRALEEIEKVSNTNQVKKDFVRRIYWKYILVEIYIILNEFDKATSEIEYLLSHPSELSVNLLKIDPLYDPLRDNPRFQELIEKYEEKG